MSIESIQNMLPDYAKDIRLNLSTLVTEESMSDQRKWGTFVACAHGARNADLIRLVEAEAVTKLSPEALNAARAAAAIMAMNNVYYKFVGMAENSDYKTLPAKLRMNVIANPGVDKVDFELWSLAVSAINGCGFCVNAHDAVLVKAGVDKAEIQAAVRIGAVMNATAAILDGVVAIEQSMAKAA